MRRYRSSSRTLLHHIGSHVNITEQLASGLHFEWRGNWVARNHNLAMFRLLSTCLVCSCRVWRAYRFRFPSALNTTQWNPSLINPKTYNPQGLMICSAGCVIALGADVAEPQPLRRTQSGIQAWTKPRSRLARLHPISPRNPYGRLTEMLQSTQLANRGHQ